MSGILDAFFGAGGRITNTFSITAGQQTGPPLFEGYQSGVIGTLNSGGNFNGPLLNSLYDDVTNANSFLKVSGFASNPGQAWLVSVTANSITRTGAAAGSFSFAGGIATWEWLAQKFNFANGTTYAGSTVTHN